MNFYDKKLNSEIASFKQTIKCLTDNKTTIDQFEKLVEAIKDNGIACDYMVVLQEYTQSVSLFLFKKVALESDIIKALHITATYLKIDIDTTKALLDINHCSYGFSLPMTGKNILHISLDRLKQHYSPLDVERILNEAKTTVPEPFFIGIDLSATNSDRSVMLTNDGLAENIVMAVAA